MARDKIADLLPRADSIPTLVLPKPVVSESFVSSLLDFYGEKNTEALIGYGSRWIPGVASKTSLPDVMGFVRDIYKFHTKNMDQYPHIYGPGGADWFTDLNKHGLTYVRPTLDIGGEAVKMKTPVISLSSAERLAGGGVRGDDNLVYGSLRGVDMHFQGKLQKPGLALIYPEVLPNGLALAINQARIEGFAVSLYLLPREFRRGEAIYAYTNLSYLIDPRPEPKDKVPKMIESNKQGFDQLFDILSEAFIKTGVLENKGNGVYETKIDLNNREAIQRQLVRAWLTGLALNYGKNFISGNMMDSLGYGFMKVFRSWGIDSQVLETLNSARSSAARIKERTMKL